MGFLKRYQDSTAAGPSSRLFAALPRDTLRTMARWGGHSTRNAVKVLCAISLAGWFPW